MNYNENGYDIGIIGAGVIGCAISRELSKYKINLAVFEKNSDVGFETSSRNSGVLHAGFNYTHGCLRGTLNVKGNSMMKTLCQELKVPFKYIGKLTIAEDEEEIRIINQLKKQGDKNGVPKLRIIEKHEIKNIQLGIPKAKKALYSPTSGIIDPFRLTLAYAENAFLNGVDFFFETEIAHIEKREDYFIVSSTKENYYTCNILINAAGLYADKICYMLGINEYKIYPCKGEYWILDKKLSDRIKTLVYPTPRNDCPGLGIHATPTIDGNILIGPSNEYIDKYNNYENTREVMIALKNRGIELLGKIVESDFIRSFSGLRPKLTPPQIGGNRDFVIEDRKDVQGFINLIGIESPGLTSSPAIAEMVRDMISNYLELEKKDNFIKENDEKLRFNLLTDFEKVHLIKKDSNWGEIICRCEKVTKQEIINAVKTCFGKCTIKGIKLRTRAMTGRCQSGFCLNKIINILINEFEYKIEDITLKGEGSELLYKR